MGIFLKDLCATSIGCMAANVVTHPLEMIKTRQMLNGSSFFLTLNNVVKAEGIQAVYKGITPALARGAVSGGGRLAGFNWLKSRAIDRRLLTPNGNTTLNEAPLRATLAVISGGLAMFAAAPFDLVRTQQSANTLRSPPSMTAVFRQVISHHGVWGLFNGVVPLLGRTAIFNVSQLLTYDFAKLKVVQVLHLQDTNQIEAHLAASAVAGFVASIASCPADNLKTIMQADVSKPPRTMGATITMMFKTHGARSFWRGLLPLYVKLGPHTVLVFTITERLRITFGVTPS
eukprot:m.72959 g.72959  ORF g.72959 m.72959 type:complete len:287 (+) comp24502_c0_seq1:560-1420(+)